MKKYNPTHKKGFAMLFTVLLMSLVLSIGLSLSSLSLKQTLLSSLAKDSQVAFYQADAGAECGMYYDYKLGVFPQGRSLSDVQTNTPSINCGNDTLILDVTNSDNDYFIYQSNNSDPTKSCYNVLFDKRTAENIIQGYGYNICNVSNPRQVERGLEIRY